MPELIEVALPSVELRADLDRAVEFALEEKSPATRRAYASDFKIFRAWCTVAA